MEINPGLILSGGKIGSGLSCLYSMPIYKNVNIGLEMGKYSSVDEDNDFLSPGSFIHENITLFNLNLSYGNTSWNNLDYKIIVSGGYKIHPYTTVLVNGDFDFQAIHQQLDGFDFMAGAQVDYMFNENLAFGIKSMQQFVGDGFLFTSLNFGFNF